MSDSEEAAPSQSGGRYRNPPEQSRFRKGQSGNPGGRPKGSRNLTTLIEQELDEVITITEGEKRKRLSKRQIIAKKLVNEAAQGNPRAWQHLFAIVDRSHVDPTDLDGASADTIANFLKRHGLGPGGQNGSGEGSQ